MSRPVPVLHVITMLELGGAQQNTLHTLARLDRERFAPRLACGPGGLLDDEARALGDVPVHFVPSLARPIRPRADLAAASALRSLLGPLVREGPVLVHTHSSKAGIVGRWAAHRAGAGPVVHSIHGFGHEAIGHPLARRLGLALERHMARYTNAFIGVSHANLEEGGRLGLLGDRPCRVIRSGIDIERYAAGPAHRDATRQALGVPPRAPLVGMIACLKPQKAPLDFVELAARVLAGNPEARFLLAGDGELRGAVEQRLRERSLGERFQLLGWRRDVPELLGALDVLVLTSRWEGLPRVCPQAMAAARPVVATAVDGIPEAVLDGRNGLLFAPGDVAAGAGHVLRLLGDPELRARMGRAGREAVGEFSAERMVAEQEELYEDLLASRRAGSGR